MLFYEQATGRLLHGVRGSAVPIAYGYAGAKGGINDPASDHIRNIGPVPKGHYYVRLRKHPRFAAPAFYLDPWTVEQLKGRSGFWIHGDNARLDRTGSSGCIVLDRASRERIRHMKDHVLCVEAVHVPF